MTFDGVLLSATFELALAVLTTLLGVVVLLRGRRLPWLFSGATAFLLGVLAVRVINFILGNSAESVEGRLWENLLPIGAGVFGVIAGRMRPIIAYTLIGLFTGGALAVWFSRIFLPTDTGLDFWSAVAVVIFMGLGMLFVQRYAEVALILLSAGVGASLIRHGLALPTDLELVAALGIAAMIAGVVIQYHDYLIELRVAHSKQETGLDESAGPEAEETGIVPLPTK